MAFAKAVAELSAKKQESKMLEFNSGYTALLRALSEPFRQIVKNAGERDASVALNDVLKEKNVNYGYNASENVYVADMIKAGIIDPLKVTRTALESAVSVAAILLTSEAMVVDKPEKKQDHAHGMPDMGGMM